MTLCYSFFVVKTMDGFRITFNINTIKLKYIFAGC